MDLAVGGVGMRRGRPDRELRVGDPIDFWRVEVYDPPFHLRLSAEMKVPARPGSNTSEAGRPGSSITQRPYSIRQDSQVSHTGTESILCTRLYSGK